MKKLTIYFCRKEIQSFEECLRPKTQNRQYVLVKTTAPLDGTDYQIYIVKGEPKQPKWLSFVKGYIEEAEVADVTNRTCSMVILLKLQTTDGPRICAVSNGFGYHIINRDTVEPNFGLITTLNCVNPKKIKSMDTRSLGIQTLQKREASNLFTDLGEFAFEFDSEILQIISGACSDTSIGTRMSGSDSLGLTTDVIFSDVPSKCLVVYEKFKLDVYKTKFEFIDHIKYEKDSNIINALDAILGSVPVNGEGISS